MTNKIKLLTGIVSVILVLTGCDAKETTQTSETTVTTQSEESITETTTETITENVTTSSGPIVTSDDVTTAEETVNESDESTDLDTSIYDDFLFGNQTADISGYAEYPCYSIFDGFDKLPSDCTLNEITDQANSNFDSYAPQIDSVISYTYIDCGRDNIPELLVRLTGDAADETELTMIFKDYDGQIKMCYAYITWSRCTISINKNGYLAMYGSSGAYSHNFTDAYIDADGHYQLLTDTIFEGMIDVINCYPGLETLGDNLLNSHAWNDGLYIEGFRFSKDEPYYVTFRFIDNIEPYENVYTEGEYYDIFTTSEVLFVLPDEQTQLMLDNYADKQCGDDFMLNEELEWNELKQ